LLDRITQRLLDWQAPSGAVVVAVVGGPLHGALLRLDLALEREYWLGSYERQFPAAVQRVCKPGMIVYDIGANIGYTSLLFARAVGRQGRVYAFEPLPENIRRLTDHVALNAAQQQIHLLPYAVSDQEGSETFLVHRSAAMGKLVGSAERETSYVDRIEVRSIRLDELVSRDEVPPPQVIKLDIEGGGVKALPGMRRTLAEHTPIMLLELHGPEEQQVVWELLVPLGYRLLQMQRGYPAVASRADLGSRWRQHVLALPASQG
jgi:FkbM family methyltransferase